MEFRLTNKKVNSHSIRNILSIKNTSHRISALRTLYKKKRGNFGLPYIIANYLMLRSPRKAREYLVKYLLVNPSDVNGWLKLVDICIEERYIVGALIASAIAVWLVPSEKALLYYTTALEEFGHYSLAIKYLRLLKNISPNEAVVYHNMGVAYERMGKIKTAIRNYTQAVNINPNLAESWYGIGRCNLLLDNAEEGIDALKKALELKEDPRYYYMLARCYVELEEYENAEKALKEAIFLDDQNEDYWELLGWVFMKEEKYTESVKSLRKAAEYYEWSSSIWYKMGLAFLEMEDGYHAELAFRRAKRISPNDFATNYYIGVAQKMMGKNIHALNNFIKAAKLNPHSPEVWEEIGETYERMGEYELAEKAFERAESIKNSESDDSQY